MIHKGCLQYFFKNALGIFIKISTFLKGFYFLIFLFLPIYIHANSLPTVCTETGCIEIDN